MKLIMKLSKYNIAVLRNNKVIIFNTYRNSYVLLSQEQYSKLLDKSYLSNLQINHNVIFDKLIGAGVILDDTTDEYQLLLNEYNKQVLDSSIYDLTLLPSLDCNLRCWYCYEKHIKGSHLSEEIQNKIFKHVVSVFENNKLLEGLNVEMFGGEPLLYFDSELYPLLKRIKDYSEKSNKYASFFFITNGVCINESNIHKFRDLNASFQISIDGYKTTHDKVKFINPKGGTYDHIIKVVHMIVNQDAFMFINLRINYSDETLEYLPMIIQDLKNVDRNKIRIHLERVWQTSSEGKCSSEKLMEVINEFILNGFDVSYMNLSRRSCSCKASKSMHSIISYDGAVYKCTGRDFTSHHQEGILDDNGIISWDKVKYDKRISIRTFEAPKCNSCKLLPLCWGPCNQKILERGFSDISQFCQINNMEMSLEDYVIYRFNNYYSKYKLNSHG